MDIILVHHHNNVLNVPKIAKNVHHLIIALSVKLDIKKLVILLVPSVRSGNVLYTMIAASLLIVLKITWMDALTVWVKTNAVNVLMDTT